MSSAWGASFGVSWGLSWGLNPAPVIGPDHGAGKKRKRKKVASQEVAATVASVFEPEPLAEKKAFFAPLIERQVYDESDDEDAIIALF